MNKDLARFTGDRKWQKNILSFFLSFGFIICFPLINSLSAEELTISGITEPYQEVVLGLTVYGQIGKSYFKEGDKVKKGALIIELDKQLEQLEVSRRNLIWENKAEIKSATAHAAMLEPQLKSTKTLYQETGSVSKEELEKQELEYALALAKIEQLESSEERERIEYLIAKVQLNKRLLHAPFTGILSKVFLKVGESCEPDEPLVQIVDVKRFYFVCNVEEVVYKNLKLNKSVKLEIESTNELIKRSGTVNFISPVVDPASGLRKIKILVENGDGAVIPGVSGAMVLQTVE